MQCVETEGLQKALVVNWIYQKLSLMEMTAAKSVLSEERNRGYIGWSSSNFMIKYTRN